MNKKLIFTLAATTFISYSTASMAVDTTTTNKTNTTTSTDVNNDLNATSNTGIYVGDGARINGGIKRVRTGDSTIRASQTTDVDNRTNVDASTTAKTEVSSDDDTVRKGKYGQKYGNKYNEHSNRAHTKVNTKNSVNAKY